ncbi:PREDICTED: importin subunit alpha-1-like [Camelina sativa]|uniref:Importin subunit alpha-1-like n=1 Tax=Camelina sativa TaxID=90675 RepID=A0ABM1QGU7_CAMSA|nr:PREDICTED: importin subunit alpha-1-like [Camelina sativa]
MYIYFLIHHGVLPPLANLLTKDYGTTWKKIKKDACWAISNITAGTEEQIQAVLDENLIPTLVKLAQSAEFDIKEKAVRAISNAALGGSHDQIRFLVEQGCIKPLCDLLLHPEPVIISACLNGLEKILEVGKAVMMRIGGNVNNYTQRIEDAEGLQKIENIQHHENNEISEKASKILTTYWQEDDGEN